MNILKLIVSVVAPNAKALVAFAVSGVVTYLAQQGIVLDDVTSNALIAGWAGLLTAVCVWITKNK